MLVIWAPLFMFISRTCHSSKITSTGSLSHLWRSSLGRKKLYQKCCTCFCSKNSEERETFNRENWIDYFDLKLQYMSHINPGGRSDWGVSFIIIPPLLRSSSMKSPTGKNCGTKSKSFSNFTWKQMNKLTPTVTICTSF